MFTPEMIRWLSENACGKMYNELTSAFNGRFGTKLSIRQIQQKCVRNGIKTGTQHSGLGHKGHMAIGTEKITGGLSYVKSSMLGGGRGWRRRHLVEWEAENGPLPKAHCVVFADGDKGNFAPENLLLVHRRELSLMNRFKMWKRNPEVTKTNLFIIRHRLAILDRVKGLVKTKRAEALEDKVRRLVSAKEEGRKNGGRNGG